MILEIDHIDLFLNKKFKILTQSDLGVSAGNQTHIGLLEDSFEEWRDTRKVNTYVLYGKKLYYSCSLIDPIQSQDGNLRSPKLRQGSNEELNGITSTLLLIRDIAKPGDGLSLIKAGEFLVILIIPYSKIDHKEDTVRFRHIKIYQKTKELDIMNMNLLHEQISKKLESKEVEELIIKTELVDIVDDIRILNVYHNWSYENLVDFIINTDRFRLRNWGIKSEYLFLKSILDFINKNTTNHKDLLKVKVDGDNTNSIKINKSAEKVLSINELQQLEPVMLRRFYERHYVNIWSNILKLNRGNLSFLKITNEIGLKWPTKGYIEKKISDYNYDRPDDLFKVGGLGNKKHKIIILAIYWASLGEEFKKQIESIASPALLFSLSSLSKIQTDVLTFRYLDKDTRTLEETGKILKVTRERVRQIESAAIKKIKLLGQKDVCRKWVRNNSDNIWKLLSNDNGLTVKGNSTETHLNHRLPGEYQLGLLIADLNASEILDEVGDRIDDWWLRRDE